MKEKNSVKFNNLPNNIIHSLARMMGNKELVSLAMTSKNMKKRTDSDLINKEKKGAKKRKDHLRLQLIHQLLRNDGWRYNNVTDPKNRNEGLKEYTKLLLIKLKNKENIVLNKLSSKTTIEEFVGVVMIYKLFKELKEWLKHRPHNISAIVKAINTHKHRQFYQNEIVDNILYNYGGKEGSDAIARHWKNYDSNLLN
jgi:hypothetical protein